MQGILKEIYDYKVDLINHLKAKESQKSLESKILNCQKPRGFINKIYKWEKSRLNFFSKEYDKKS